jgi:hypothetical protein
MTVIYGSPTGRSGKLPDGASTADGQSSILESLETQAKLVDALDSQVILGDILKELKKINLHLSLMTDETIKNTEVG